eukprot:m.235294 g.235294  ORF g.235294 m.235294 type:complete len:104 (+) comp19333_c0_seq1:426-737(+)
MPPTTAAKHRCKLLLPSRMRNNNRELPLERTPPLQTRSDWCSTADCTHHMPWCVYCLYVFIAIEWGTLVVPLLSCMQSAQTTCLVVLLPSAQQQSAAYTYSMR